MRENLSIYNQVQGLAAARVFIDDGSTSKFVFQFQPLIGAQDGNNLFFQIPQERVVLNVAGGLFPQIYSNKKPLAYTTDYSLTSPKNGVVAFVALNVNIPKPEDEIAVSFYYTWFDDIEWDAFLNRAAGEIGFTRYYSRNADGSLPTVAVGTETLPTNGLYPTDIPDALFNAIGLLGASAAARTLALRFASRYDTSAGDQSFSPSQMSTAFQKLAVDLEKKAYMARDDFYKGQGRQYATATGVAGFVLPQFTPRR